jgi:hypothetical protein
MCDFELFYEKWCGSRAAEPNFVRFALKNPNAV